MQNIFNCKAVANKNAEAYSIDRIEQPELVRVDLKVGNKTDVTGSSGIRHRGPI